MNKNLYATEQNKRQIHWLKTSETLPLEARAGGTYTDRAGTEHGPLPLFLPRDLAAHNLLPDVRDGARRVATGSRPTVVARAGKTAGSSPVDADLNQLDARCISARND